MRRFRCWLIHVRHVDMLSQSIGPSEGFITEMTSERLDAGMYREMTLKIGDIRIALIAVFAVVIVNAVMPVGVALQYSFRRKQTTTYCALAAFHTITRACLKREIIVQTRVIQQNWSRTKWSIQHTVEHSFRTAVYWRPLPINMNRLLAVLIIVLRWPLNWP